ncbi:MAG: hypothetical protein AAB784_02455 [Patescibacteria group bacterium]
MKERLYINEHHDKKVQVICTNDIVINGILASTANDIGNDSSAPYIILRDARFQRSLKESAVMLLFCRNIICIIPNPVEDT